MADKTLGDKIWRLKNERISPKEAERAEWASSLRDVGDLIAQGGSEADEYKALKKDAEEFIASLDAELENLYAELAELEAQLPAKAEPKYDPEMHPILKKATTKVEPVKLVTFSAGDYCEAQWTDRQWYKAKVQTVMGSSSDPKYLVTFLDYKDSALTVGRDTIRPLPNEKKRKAENAAAMPTVAPASNSPHVISGPASVNPHATAAKKEGPDNGAPTNRRKIGSGKALERKASDWKNFTMKGPGKKSIKKDSMFRTGEGVNSRVGFTGSGAGMSETRKRVRYDKKAGAEDEPDDSNGVPLLQAGKDSNDFDFDRNTNMESPGNFDKPPLRAAPGIQF